MYFQFPLLGIFPCTRNISCIRRRRSHILSIPVTWDFSMHLAGDAIKGVGNDITFNSRYLGFFHAPIFQLTPQMTHIIPFNSRYLGFFHAPLTFCLLRLHQTISLSIPVTWDFSMHLTLDLNAIKAQVKDFQFPLLGIFPCTFNILLITIASNDKSFNSRYLGFFHAPHILQISLQFRCTETFNSRYLGFFHAPCGNLTRDCDGKCNFQFPLLGIFPCTPST